MISAPSSWRGGLSCAFSARVLLTVRHRKGPEEAGHPKLSHVGGRGLAFQEEASLGGLAFALTDPRSSSL